MKKYGHAIGAPPVGYFIIESKEELAECALDLQNRIDRTGERLVLLGRLRIALLVRKGGVLVDRGHDPFEHPSSSITMAGSPHHRIKEMEAIIPELLIDEHEFLISIALNRRHWTEGQKAVLANEYRKVLSEKQKSQRAKIAVTQREIKRGNISSDTLIDRINQSQEIDTRKEASEKFKVPERKVRTVQEISIR